MPLNTEIIRNGEPLQLKWNSFHILAMVLASSFEEETGPFGDMTNIYANDLHTHPYMPYPIASSLHAVISYPMLARTALGCNGVHELVRDHSFIDLRDGEVLELKAGDKLVMYRGL